MKSAHFQAPFFPFFSPVEPYSRLFGVLALLVASLGCITINLYFPESEIRAVAEEIVQEARSGVDLEKTLPSAGDGAAVEAIEETSWVQILFPTAYADEGKDKLDLKTTTPLISKIRKTLKARYKKLLPFYKNGAVGEGYWGLLQELEGTVPGAPRLGIKEKRDLKALLEAENKDRENLYAELARANNLDKSRLKDIGRIFSQEWQESALVGSFIEVKPKKWEKKKPKKKEKENEKKSAESEKAS